MTYPAPLKVLYIAGSGRSGSTLLERLVGQAPDTFAAGELRYFWQRGLVDNRLCGCGAAFRDCLVWRGILGSAFSGGPPDAASTATRQRRRTRLTLLPRVVLENRLGRGCTLDGDTRALAELYRGIAERTGCRLLIDSSKLPPYGELVRRLPNVEFYVVHLVRDPRASAYSWLRNRVLPDFDGRLMQRQPPAKSAALWLVWNAAAELLWRRRTGRYLRLRYEDLLADPRGVVRSVLQFVAEPVGSLDFVGSDTADLSPTHSVAGNPSRLHSGRVPLATDEEWRTRMRPVDRWTVTGLAWPLLHRYEYPLASMRSGTG